MKPVIDTATLTTPQRELLALSKVCLEHPTMVDCEREIREAISLSAGHDVLLVVGPTGVGKTTVQRALLQPARSSAFGLPLLVPVNEGAIPIISVTAHNGKNFLSRWKQLLQDILKAVNPVLYDFGKISDPYAARPSSTGRSLDHVSVARLLSLVTDGLKLRQTRAILVDESHHLAPSASHSDYSLMAESLKELGSNSGTVLVLFGCYPLLPFARLSAQLARRSAPVHFRRYRVGSDANGADSEDFRRVVFSFIKQAPTLLPQTLMDSLPFLYCGSLGCTGVLRDWLVRTAAKAISRRAACVTPELLEVTALPVGALQQMRAEAEWGEAKFQEQRGPMAKFMADLLAGSPCLPAPAPGAAREVRRRAGRAGKAIERALTRDPAGGFSE